jgi:cephalosporin hydroxylase
VAAADRARSITARMRASVGRARSNLYHRLATSPVVPRLYRYGLVARTHNFVNATYAGVPCVQSPLDLWALQEAISQLRPALLIEIGSYEGGSALFYAQLMDALGSGRVLSIDLRRPSGVEHPRVEFIEGDSLDPTIVGRARAEAEAADGHVLVILDGDHGRDHVAGELEAYAPLVTPGSLLLSQDGLVDELEAFAGQRPGPLPANREFLAAHPEFEYDAELGDRYGFTTHPLGWLRRRT